MLMSYRWAAHLYFYMYLYLYIYLFLVSTGNAYLPVQYFCLYPQAFPRFPLSVGFEPPGHSLCSPWLKTNVMSKIAFPEDQTRQICNFSNDWRQKTFSLELLPDFLKFIVKSLKSSLLSFPVEKWVCIWREKEIWRKFYPGISCRKMDLPLKRNKLETFEDALWKREKLQHVKLKTLRTWLISMRKAECGKSQG